MVGAFVWMRQHPPGAAGIPPDLGVPDSAVAAEITSRQGRVQEDGTAEAWTDLATVFITYGFFAEADTCCRAESLSPEENLNNFWWAIALYRLGHISESNEKFRVAAKTAQPSQAPIIWYCIGRICFAEDARRTRRRCFERPGPCLPPSTNSPNCSCAQIAPIKRSRCSRN
ncbi:MAG: hypothetical protein U0992_23625 [Planctomycetaceae bacterium]